MNYSVPQHPTVPHKLLVQTRGSPQTCTGRHSWGSACACICTVTVVKTHTVGVTLRDAASAVLQFMHPAAPAAHSHGMARGCLVNANTWPQCSPVCFVNEEHAAHCLLEYLTRLACSLQPVGVTSVPFRVW